MKKALALLLALVMILSLAACGQEAAPAADTPAAETPAADTPASAEPEAVTYAEPELSLTFPEIRILFCNSFSFHCSLNNHISFKFSKSKKYIPN